jgi:hypothetical protein
MTRVLVVFEVEQPSHPRFATPAGKVDAPTQRFLKKR